jgi:hypothetical protein
MFYEEGIIQSEYDEGFYIRQEEHATRYPGIDRVKVIRPINIAIRPPINIRSFEYMEPTMAQTCYTMAVYASEEVLRSCEREMGLQDKKWHDYSDEINALIKKNKLNSTNTDEIRIAFYGTISFVDCSKIRIRTKMYLKQANGESNIINVSIIKKHEPQEEAIIVKKRDKKITIIDSNYKNEHENEIISSAVKRIAEKYA